MAELSIFHRLFYLLVSLLLHLLVILLRLLIVFSNNCCVLIQPHQIRTRPKRDPTPSNPVVIPNDLIEEIVKLLPVKSLMRFKCVSKNWLSIITDPSFTSAYPGGFRGPIVFRPCGCQDPYKVIYYLNIEDTGPTATC